jgi:class 3 adenylate cyclase
VSLATAAPRASTVDVEPYAVGVASAVFRSIDSLDLQVRRTRRRERCEVHRSSIRLLVVATPEVRYARTTDGAHLAFTVTGAGPIDLVEVGNGTNMSIEAADEQPRWLAFVDALSAFSRLVRFDPRGIGLSDPLPASGATIEQYAEDTLAVMDAAGSVETALLAVGHSGPVAIYLASTRPSVVRALVLVNTYARVVRSDDYPHGIPASVYDRFVDVLVDPATGSGKSTGPVDDLPLMAPSRGGDSEFRTWWRLSGHRGASPATARAMFRLARDSDVRSLLPEVRAPSLVVHSVANNYVRVDHGRYLASHLSKVMFSEVPSADHLPWTDDQDVAGEIEEFLTGTRHAPAGNRRLATILFSDIVHSTETARSLGDRVWRGRLDRHDVLAQRQISRFGGRFVKSMGDGVLATFDGPAAAIRCAQTMSDAMTQIGVAIRCGIHIGEIEQRGDDIAGIAVHTAQRICASAGSGETFVSRMVTDLVAGSGIEFEDRGTYALKGVSGSWNLFAAKR